MLNNLNEFTQLTLFFVLDKFKDDKVGYFSVKFYPY